jgi:predicted small lipoprotein YifL
MKIFVRILCIAMLLSPISLLTACGQSGKLYLPNQAEETNA